MKNVLLTAATALSLSAAAASAAVVTIDFDTNATGFYGPNDGSQTYNAGSYQGTGIDGLLFGTPILVQAANSGAGPGQSGNVGQQATPPFGGDPKGGAFGGLFDGFTVSSLSIVVGDSGGDLDIFQLVGYDAGGNVVDDTGDIGSNAATTVSISGSGIASFDLFIADIPDNQGSSFFDNIVFDTEVGVVPLPATLPMIGFGLLALGALARRRSA